MSCSGLAGQKLLMRAKEKEECSPEGLADGVSQDDSRAFLHLSSGRRQIAALRLAVAKHRRWP